VSSRRLLTIPFGWKPGGEARALAGLAPSLEAAAMLFEDLLRCRESETGAEALGRNSGSMILLMSSADIPGPLSDTDISIPRRVRRVSITIFGLCDLN
jgi:hypothetical protein